MGGNGTDVVENFLENFKEEIDLKIKTHNSNEEQLLEISKIFIEYLKYHDSFILGEQKVVNSANGPCSYIEIKSPEDSSVLLNGIQDSLIELGVNFKRHNFKGSLPLFSVKNSSFPGILYGRGSSLISLQSPTTKKTYILKIECLAENQLVKVLDGNIENLTIAFWTGKSVSRTIFRVSTDLIDDDIEEERIFSLNLVSEHPKNPYKITGMFYKTLNDSLILDKITSINRN